MRILSSILLLIVFADLSAESQARSPPSISVVAAVAPVYPQRAISPEAIMGAVRVEAQVDSGGAVVSARAVSGHPVLYKAAEAAARRWAFSPSGSGEMLRRVTLLFKFTFVDDRTPEEELGPVFKPPFEVEVRARERVIIQRETRVRTRRLRVKY
jgi:TonB family protein